MKLKNHKRMLPSDSTEMHRMVECALNGPSDQKWDALKERAENGCYMANYLTDGRKPSRREIAEWGPERWGVFVAIVRRLASEAMSDHLLSRTQSEGHMRPTRAEACARMRWLGWVGHFPSTFPQSSEDPIWTSQFAERPIFAWLWFSDPAAVAFLKGGAAFPWSPSNLGRAGGEILRGLRCILLTDLLGSGLQTLGLARSLKGWCGPELPVEYASDMSNVLEAFGFDKYLRRLNERRLCELAREFEEAQVVLAQRRIALPEHDPFRGGIPFIQTVLALVDRWKAQDAIRILQHSRCPVLTCAVRKYTDWEVRVGDPFKSGTENLYVKTFRQEPKPMLPTLAEVNMHVRDECPCAHRID